MRTPLTTNFFSAPLQGLPDKELHDLFRTAGDDEVLAEQVFNVIYSRHTMPVWCFIRYKVQSYEDAEDIFVETWKEAIKGLSVALQDIVESVT